MKRCFLFMLYAECLLGSLVACQMTEGSSSSQPTPVVTETNTPIAYELTPGETIQSYPLGGEEESSDFVIGTDSLGSEKYVDESGKTVERWVAGLWIGSEQCSPARSHIVRIGDIVEFDSYQFRILDVSNDNITFAIRKTASTPTTCEHNPYNALPGETIFWANLGVSHLTESLEFDAENPRIEKYTDTNGEIVERWAAKVKLSCNQISQIWEGTVYIGDSIEFAGYRIGILDIDETSLYIAYGPLNKLQATSENNQ